MKCDRRKNVLMVIVKIPMMTITLNLKTNFLKMIHKPITLTNLSTRNVIERLKELEKCVVLRALFVRTMKIGGPGVKCKMIQNVKQPFNNEDFDREIKSIFPYLDPKKAQKHPYNKSIISLIQFNRPDGTDSPIEMMEINLYNIPEGADLELTFACLHIVLKLFHSPDQASMLDIFNTDPEIQEAKSRYPQLKNLNNVINILRELQSQALGGNVRWSGENPEAVIRDPPTAFLPVFMIYTTQPGAVYREIYPSSSVDFNTRIISDRNIASRIQKHSTNQN